MPQVHPSCVTTTTTESAAEIPAAMETETDETASAETSEANVSIETVSKESHDTSLSDVEQIGSSVVPDAQLTTSSSSSAAAAAVCCERNCCDDVTATVQTNDDCSRGDNCHSDSCRSDSVVVDARTDLTRCSDYEAASVLSDMQQLANIAAAAATSPARSTSFSTSDTQSTSLNTVNRGQPSYSASCFTSTLALAASGE